MAFDYRIDAARRLVLLRPGTAPTLQDWTDVLDRLIADPSVEPGFGIISDRRHIAVAPNVDYVRGSMQALADRHPFAANRRIAVVTSNTASFGMGRMAEAFAEARGLQFRVFLDLEEAVRWAREEADGN